MSPRTVTVFVCRKDGIFHANTSEATATDDRSATRAARLCAARHLEHDASAIDLLPNGPHVMIASVRQPRRAQRAPYLTRSERKLGAMVLVLLGVGLASVLALLIWGGPGR